MKRYVLLFTMISVLLISSGCATTKRNQSLEKVAKDWCMVIRASQIVPVYPLTEDLQVGDIFLVQRTVDQQHKDYKERGFLPMDNHIDRLKLNGFKNFYDRSFISNDDNLTLPGDWLEREKETSWSKAPGASFPTYSFSVKSGAGLNMALPVQGIPIGLSLMGADAGDGAITIGDASTYGIDTISLYDEILAWERNNHEFLLNFASKDGKSNYIRVISRVYLAGTMNVSIRSSQSRSGGLSAGAPKPVDLLTMKTAKDETDVEKNATENYTKSIENLNRSIENTLKTISKDGMESVMPGGTVKVVAASSRAISMKETFKRPLAVGYLAFDLAIGPDGILGPPIPTHSVLNKETSPAVPLSSSMRLISNARLGQAYGMIDRRTDDGDTEAIMLKTQLDKLCSLLPETYPVPIYSFDNSLNQLKRIKNDGIPLRDEISGMRCITTYRGELISSIAEMERDDSISDELSMWLKLSRDALEELNMKLRQHRNLLRQANEYASYF